MTACFRPSAQYLLQVPRRLKFRYSAEIQYCIFTCYGLVFEKQQGLFLSRTELLKHFARWPFLASQITTDPHILAHVNTEWPDNKYPELEIYI
jgi:hypothetical protein